MTRFNVLTFEGFQLQNAFTLLLLSKKHSYLLTAKITPYFLTLVIVGIMGIGNMEYFNVNSFTNRVCEKALRRKG